MFRADGQAAERKKRERRATRSAARRSWGLSGRRECGAAGEARIRGFASPAFAGFALVRWLDPDDTGPGRGCQAIRTRATCERTFDVAVHRARRDRIVRVAEWAWPHLEERLASLRPNDLLFSDVDRWAASDAHRAARRLAEIENYQPRDQRHSYAVRAARALTPAELIARGSLATLTRCSC